MDKEKVVAMAAKMYMEETDIKVDEALDETLDALGFHNIEDEEFEDMYKMLVERLKAIKSMLKNEKKVQVNKEFFIEEIKGRIKHLKTLENQHFKEGEDRKAERMNARRTEMERILRLVEVGTYDEKGEGAAN